MSHRARPPFTRSVVAGLSTAAVVAALLGSAPGAANAGEAARPAGTDRVQQDRAQRVLAEAESLFDGKPTRLSPGRDATMVLRDLVLARESLDGLERRQADRLLARPAASQAACTDTACFHWTETGGDAIDPTDGDASGFPDYIEQVAGALGSVQQTYVDAGYRPVKSDGSKGGSGLPDVYIEDLGADSLYGYCATDQTEFPQGKYDAWAYCALDNDYKPSQFPTNTPLENMQVTAAHEYFHAVQFAYDYFEDNWFMEATATWAEDELYDDVDDNLNYLPYSPLARPGISLDTFNRGGFQYGTWLFFRYLTEQLPTESGGMPSLVRDMWAKADGASGGPDQYSMQAVASVLKARGTSLAAMFGAFADGNLRPGTTYDEGTLNGYLPAPLGKFAKKSGWYVTTLDHMSSTSARVAPQPGTKTLKIVLDLPPKATGSGAVISVSFIDGTVETTRMSLNKKGNGSGSYPFDAATVKTVELTLVNASTKYKCWVKTSYSCQGRPLQDNLTNRLKLLTYS